ncbi:hypothetical protein G3A39_42835 [Paraburkholderia aspalathi]|nr:hypothetical protein [Paraburkholderia aspalathi]
MSWQPIETAPKDKAILVYQAQNRIMATARDVDEYGNWKTGSVTHWTPLPTHPQEVIE